MPIGANFIIPYSGVMNMKLPNVFIIPVTFSFLVISAFTTVLSATDSETAITAQTFDDAKNAFVSKDYSRTWNELDKITKWLEANAPRSGLSWQDAEQMIKKWVKKNWREDVISVEAQSDGGMETTTERHQGSFYGWTWDTGQKTETTDFVFEASVKAINSKGKVLLHKIRFHFDKNNTGWYIKRAGVM
jgi:hypothetical protein